MIIISLTQWSGVIRRTRERKRNCRRTSVCWLFYYKIQQQILGVEVSLLTQGYLCSSVCSPFIFILQVGCQCDHGGQDLSDPSYLVRQLGQTVSEEKFPVKFVTASAHQLLELQDVGGGAEGGGNHEGEQQLLGTAAQLGQQGMDFLPWWFRLILVMVMTLNNAMLSCGHTKLNAKLYKPQWGCDGAGELLCVYHQQHSQPGKHN